MNEVFGSEPDQIMDISPANNTIHQLNRKNNLNNYYLILTHNIPEEKTRLITINHSNRYWRKKHENQTFLFSSLLPFIPISQKSLLMFHAD